MLLHAVTFVAPLWQLFGAPSRYPYQSTTLKATASLALPHGDLEVDITNLVKFTSSNGAVAHAGMAAGSAIRDWNVTAATFESRLWIACASYHLPLARKLSPP